MLRHIKQDNLYETDAYEHAKIYKRKWKFLKSRKKINMELRNKYKQTYQPKQKRVTIGIYKAEYEGYGCKGGTCECVCHWQSTLCEISGCHHYDGEPCQLRNKKARQKYEILKNMWMCMPKVLQKCIYEYIPYIFTDNIHMLQLHGDDPYYIYERYTIFTDARYIYEGFVYTENIKSIHIWPQPMRCFGWCERSLYNISFN